MGTLEALLDNLDKKKNEDRELFTGHHVNHNGFEHDSLDEISSLSGLTTSSINSSVPAEDYTNRQVRKHKNR